MRKLLPCVLFPLFVSCGSGDPGPQGLTGPGGDPGPPGPTGAPGPQGTVPPTLNGLTPLTAFPDRVVTLQLSGVGTHFGKDTVVRFTDPALHVTKVTAASAGYLQAELHLDPSATLGPQDLTVEGPGVDPSGMPTGTTERATLQGALRVVPSLQADGNGTTAMATQGGLFDFSLIDLDRDTALAGSGRLEGGARAIHLTTLGGRLAGTALVDALATGGLALHAVYSKGGTDTAFVADGNASTSPHVSARAAKPLTAGTAITGETLAMPRQTNLYKLITSADEQVAVLSFATSGSLATNTVAGAAAPSSGRWNDGQFFYASTNMAAQTALVYMAAKGDQFLTVLAANLGGAADYGYDLTARVATAKAFSSKENAMMPDTPAMPLATVTLDAPQHSSDGAMDGPADIDYIRFQSTKAGRAYVQAVVPGQGLGVPAVTVALRAADCTTALAPPRPVQQEVTVAAGTSYCAVVSSPSSYAGPYRLILAQDL